MEYQTRIARVQSQLRRKKLDAMLISCPENRRYLCGYRGGDHGISETSGFLIVPARGQVTLITDFRFKLQAEREVPWCNIVIYERGAMKLLSELLPDFAIRHIAFESHYTLHSTARRMNEKLEKVGITTVPLENLIEGNRVIKDHQEIEHIRKAVRLNEVVFSEIHDSLDRFATEIDVALAIESTMRQKGAEGPSFSTIVASGANGALPHAVPGTTALQKDGSLTIDMGLILDGYCADMTRNGVFGKPDEQYLTLHRLVRKAQRAGMAAIKEGVRACDVDKAARSIIEEGGYGRYFGHSLGHGVGLAVHEEPRISTRNRKQLKTGMVVTVEPGIYIPGWGGIRLENMVVVRDDGHENLNMDTTWLDL